METTCDGGGFPAQRDSNAENVPIRWRHNDHALNSWDVLYTAEQMECSTLKYIQPITMKFCTRHNSCKCLSNFEFDRNIVDGTGAWLTHWSRVTHICVGKLNTIGSDNGLSPDRRQAIIWTNAGILSIGPLGTKFSEILIAIHVFSFKKMHLKMSSGKWRPSCLGLNVLTLA